MYLPEMPTSPRSTSIKYSSYQEQGWLTLGEMVKSIFDFSLQPSEIGDLRLKVLY